MTSAAFVTIKLDGALTVPHADVLHARLIAALDGRGAVTLDLSDATEIDVSFLQLLVAAQKTACARQTSLFVQSSGGSDRLMAEAARCGLSATAANGVRVLPLLSEGNL